MGRARPRWFSRTVPFFESLCTRRSEAFYWIMTNLILLLWITLLPSMTGCEESLGETHADVAVSLARHFRVSFCVIGVPEDKLTLSFVSSKANPSKRKLLTSFLSFQQISGFVRGGAETLSNPGRTMVVLRADETTLDWLAQLSIDANLSPFIWVLFSETELEKWAFRDFYVPFNCEFIYMQQMESNFSLTEIYQMEKKSPVTTYDLGYWSEASGLVFVGIHFYDRRKNLVGHLFTAVMKNNPPYVSIERDEEGNPKFKGYLYEIWSELEHRLNFRTRFPERYFDKDPDQVLKNEAVDFAVARVSITTSALENIDFSQPIDEAKSYLCGNRPGSELDWDIYLKPFSTNTWFVSLFWMFSSSLALAFLYRKAWAGGTSEREADYYIFTFSESLLTVFRAICMQGSDVTPRSNSCRLFFLSIYLTALVVTSAFSAALFSLLTIPKQRSPFNSLEEVLNNNKFLIGFPSDPNLHKMVEDFAATLPPSQQFKLLENLAVSKRTPRVDPQKELEKVCHDKFYIFTYDLPKVLFLMQNMTRTCQDKILPSGPPLFTEYIGFGFKKKNPFKELINFHLIRMKNEGILNRLMKNYWPPQIPTVQVTWMRVTLADISPIFYMFASGTFLGVIFLYSEKILRRLRKPHRVSSTLGDRILIDDRFLFSDSENSLSGSALYFQKNYKNYA